jgi:hypothetical protein
MTVPQTRYTSLGDADMPTRCWVKDHWTLSMPTV